MCSEIEAKFKVDSLDQTERRLAEFRAEFLAEQLQTDYYLDDIDAALTKTDRCLRLRRQLAAGSERFFLTYKGAKEKDRFKKRQQIEIEITDADGAERLLSALGYERALVFEKKRRVWQLAGCQVALDQLPLLGSFVEIEGPSDEKIAAVQTRLGLASLPHLTQSYALLMEQKLRELDKNEREIFL
jgi:adenylate cyclase class 2